MPPIKNARHEKFACLVAEGTKSLNAAYVAAGYKSNTARASNLAAKSSVQDRIHELKEAAARNVTIDLARLLKEYERLALANVKPFIKRDEDGRQYLEADELSDDIWAAIQEVEFGDVTIQTPEGSKTIQKITKVKLANKRGAMQDLGKYFKMFAPDITIPLDGVPPGSGVEIKVTFV